MNEDSNKSQEIELLKLEYRECQSGYNSRNRMEEDAFSKIVEVISIFLTLLIAVNTFGKMSWLVYTGISILIGSTGSICVFSLLAAMQVSSSSGMALKKRCGEIERRLHEMTGFKLRYWQAIDNRVRHFEENVVKNSGSIKRGAEKEELERQMLINAGRLLLLFWVIVITILVIA